MYNNLIEEDIMILDNEFFKIDTMFESVDKMYDIKMKELEYNYIYTESINEEYIDLYTEAEEAKSKNEQGLLGRLFTAILNFIRSIRAKILRLFGNDKKASELEAKIKGNPKVANQTVEITNTTDAEKAVDEGISFFGSLIDKVVKGTATEKDADEAEEKGKSLLSRIGIFGGGALLATGAVKVANDELKKRDKPTIQERLRNLIKKENETKKKAETITDQAEEMAKKGENALKNNSHNSNEENIKAGRGILGSFKDFITGAGKLFTGKASEIRSKINGVSSDEQQTSTSQARPKNTNTQQANDDTQQTEQKNLTPDEYYKKTIKSEKQKEFFKFKDENDKMIDEIQDYLVEISRETRLNGQNIISEYDITLKGSKRAKPHILPSMTFEKIKTYNQKLKELLDKSKKEYEDLKSKNNTMSDSFAAATAFLSSTEKDKNDESKPENKVEKQPETKSDKPEETQSKTKPEDKEEKQPETSTTDTTEQKNGKNDKTKDEQQTSTSQARPKGVSSNNSDDDKKKRTPEPNSYCDERIKKIEFYLDRGYKLTEEEQKQINEIKDRLKNKKCTENDVKILGKISAKKPPEVEMDEEIEKLMFKFHDYVYSHERPDVLSLNEVRIKKGHSIVSLEDLPKIKFPTNYYNKESDSVVEKAKIFLDSYKIYSKYKNPDKNKVMKALKNIYDNDYKYNFLDEEMHGIKITFITLDKYAKELNELIKKRETFKESSYDLINDILTIFENSF